MEWREPQFIITAAAVLAALGYIGNKALVIARAVLAVREIVQRELEHNHGSSMKDDIYGMARSLGEVQRRLDDYEDAMRRQHPNDPLFRRSREDPR